MAKGDGVKNETAVERQHRMRGVVVASPDDMKGVMFAPSPEKIQSLLTSFANSSAVAKQGGLPPL